MTHITADVTDYAERFYSDIKGEAVFVPVYKAAARRHSTQVISAMSLRIKYRVNF